MRSIVAASAEYGWGVPPVRYLMVQALFTGGVGIYAFYALQPYLLELYGDPEAYQVAGLVAAIVAGAQILGGLAAPSIRRLFHRRTSALLTTGALEVVRLALIAVVGNFWAVLGLVVVWGLLFAAATPIRQSYLNGLIPSRQRATVLSFDSMMASLGGVGAAARPGQGRPTWPATDRRMPPAPVSWRARCRSCGWRGARARPATSPPLRPRPPRRSRAKAAPSR